MEISQGPWEPLFTKFESCTYANDHTAFRDIDGNWRIIATCGKGRYFFYKERWFTEGITESLSKKCREIGKLFEEYPYKGLKLSPFVIFHKKDEVYHLFHGPSKIHHYTSPDGITWNYQGIAIDIGWFFLRDPYIFAHDGKYLLYVTSRRNTIQAFQSTDLSKWEDKGQIFKVGRGYPRSLNSSCESPVVLRTKEGFLLFTTIVPSLFGRRANYLNTKVFFSEDPLNFGTLTKSTKSNDHLAQIVGNLETHAPEVISANGKLYITTCGWPGFPKPGGVDGEGVWIARLKIN